ncbi:MAG: hypothetical protein EOP12_01005 [Pseudomonas sp.]|nr:MAG: hypothetical protein EOP12_01005 [Pseudomonas sp.]
MVRKSVAQHLDVVRATRRTDVRVESNWQTPKPSLNENIWTARRGGETYATIAARFDISVARVFRICKRQAELERRAVAKASAAIILEG